MSTTRQRMIESTAVLIREKGVEATSFTDVLEHAGATRGTIYHHFPGGKAQLIEEATAHSGAQMAAGLEALLAGEDPVAALRTFFVFWRRRLIESDFTAGCPIVAAALEGGARDAAAAAFERWDDLLTGAFERAGLEAERARSLATLAIASVEGAVVLCRAQQSIAPLDRVAAELEALAAATLTRSEHK